VQKPRSIIIRYASQQIRLDAILEKINLRENDMDDEPKSEIEVLKAEIEALKFELARLESEANEAVWYSDY
jgi:hypothetical protein